MSPSIPSIDIKTDLKGSSPPNAALVTTIAAQEAGIRFSSFNSSTAWELGSAIRELVRQRHPEIEREGKSGLVIRIALWNGHGLFESVVGDGPDVGAANW